MHTDTHSDAEPDLHNPSNHKLRRRLALILTVILIILLLAFIPPLINVSRLQRRIAHNISASIGRPVHFDRLTLGLLPTPGFTLENFVIDEDPAFGYEPILRADEVRATLRLSSFWTGHPEFSNISFGDGTSVNLVHLANGRWNIESLLFQASHISAAPTAQRHAGPAPRFPYIEATSARVNLKLDQDKTPFSLDQAEFALWEPESNQWRLRLTARPVRTDSSPSETGSFRIEGTLGAANHTANSLAATPIDLQGEWIDAQLGGLSQFVTGSDAGIRGDISATFSMQGTVEQNTITTNIRILNARRAEFIPPSPLSLEVRCQARASQTFHSFTGIACYWPPPDSADQSTLIVAAEIPDVRTPETASVRVTLPAVPASTFFDWVSIATPHPPVGLAGPGTLSGALIWGTTLGAPGLAPQTRDNSPTISGGNQRPSNASSVSRSDTYRAQLDTEGAGAFRPLKQPLSAKGALALGLSSPTPTPSWSGELEFSGGSITIPGQDPVTLGDVILQASQPASPPVRARGAKPAPPPPPDRDSFDLQPVALDLGGADPATLTGHVDDSGYTLQINGSVLPSRLLAVGKAVPQLGDGLADCLPAPSPVVPSAAAGTRRGSAVRLEPAETPVQIELTATRSWGGMQIWCPAKKLSSPTDGGKPAQATAPE
ncbi:MAG TPA: AsmA family protein [Acidobacteriaceae bacterium]|jgi:AsmA protein|nr:AsmA family protein [Acidobacteriaceae bacterium]